LCKDSLCSRLSGDALRRELLAVSTAELSLSVCSNRCVEKHAKERRVEIKSSERAVCGLKDYLRFASSAQVIEQRVACFRLQCHLQRSSRAKPLAVNEMQRAFAAATNMQRRFYSHHFCVLKLLLPVVFRHLELVLSQRRSHRRERLLASFLHVVQEIFYFH
jgi:hypothetical protein